MSKINVNTWEPESGTDLTLGASGDTATIPSGATLDVTGATVTGLGLTGLDDVTVSSSDPAIDTNPSAVGHLWLNSTSGESYVCTNATSGSNVWKNVADGSGDIAPLSVQYLVVAGGGGGGGGSWGAGTGGYRGYGGGGAGGYRTNAISETSGRNSQAEAIFFPVLSTTYTVTVGAGGAAASYGNENAGSNSVFNTITSTGGGLSSWYNPSTTEMDGGSGGGEAATGTGGGGSGTIGQGYSGGSGSGASPGNGGGGGGAGEPGENGRDTGNHPPGGGRGGNGISSNITGDPVMRAGGGGAGGSGPGGRGGGANAPTSTSGTSKAGNAATVNTGGGGSGASGYTSLTARDGGAGGSGVVILKIEDTGTATFSGGVTSSLDTSVSGYKIYTVTATSTTSETVTFTI